MPGNCIEKVGGVKDTHAHAHAHAHAHVHTVMLQGCPDKDI